MIYEITVSHEIGVKDTADINYDIYYYGTIRGGDIYFSKKLRSDDWELASDTDKLKALLEATAMIDRLNFSGDKVSETQILQFPRGTDTTIPDDIVNAAYEIAKVLLSGLDPEHEYANLAVKKQQFANIVTEYSEQKSAPPHVSAGIFSATAWRLLFPYIRTTTEVTLNRV